MDVTRDRMPRRKLFIPFFPTLPFASFPSLPDLRRKMAKLMLLDSSTLLHSLRCTLDCLWSWMTGNLTTDFSAGRMSYRLSVAIRWVGLGIDSFSSRTMSSNSVLCRILLGRSRVYRALGKLGVTASASDSDWFS